MSVKLAGGINSESRAWTTPPLNLRSCLFCQQTMFGELGIKIAYCLGNSTSSPLSTDEYHNISRLLHILYYSPSLYRCPCWTRQQCRYEHRVPWYQLGSCSRTSEYMILKDIRNDILVISFECGFEFCVWDFVKGIVIWSKDLLKLVQFKNRNCLYLL